jgi:hypothetical protein
MGGGPSIHVERQEQFVRENLQKFKKEVNSPQRYMTEYRYSDEQVKGKLRQLYHNTDTLKENRYAYINETTWGNAKRNISRW